MPITEAQGGVISAGIQAGAAIGRGIGANKRQKRARQWALEDWDRVNKYNSPQSQMQRLKEAKLNPNLIYGGSGNSGQAGAVQQTALNTSAAEEIGAGIGAIPTNAFTQRQQQAQTSDLKASTIKKAAETIGQNTKNKTDQKNLQVLNQYAIRNAEAAVSSIEENTSAVVNRELQAQRTDKSKESQEASKAEIMRIEAKLRRAGASPSAPMAVKMAILNKAELKKLLNFFN